MTESDWLTETDYHRHIEYVENRLSPRRARLLAVAFCRARLGEFDGAGMRAALEAIERYADGAATRAEVEETRSWARITAVQSTDKFDREERATARFHSLRNEFAWAVAFAAQSPLPLLKIVQYAEGVAAGHAAMRALVWDVAGNPFRPVEFDPAWRTETVLALARQMYEAREFNAMPILADALQDAGCASDDLLTHCRADCVHVRGCWVIDGVLGKA
jgi:hypothetical protein